MPGGKLGRRVPGAKAPGNAGGGPEGTTEGACGAEDSSSESPPSLSPSPSEKT